MFAIPIATAATIILLVLQTLSSSLSLNFIDVLKSMTIVKCQRRDSALSIHFLYPCVFIYLHTSIDVIPLILSPIFPVIPLCADK